MSHSLLPPSPLTAQLPSPELPDANEPTPRPSKLPRATTEQPPITAAVDRTPVPGKLFEPSPPHGTLPPVPPLPPLYPRLPEPPETAQLPAVDLDFASSPVRSRGTPRSSTAPGEQIRTLVFAPERTRAAWIERELSRTPITVQIGRTARNVVAALTRDPPPRPDVLVVDFDAVSPVELVELAALRPGGWFGRLIALGHVPPELRTVFGVDHVLAPPLVRDSLLDYVAGTRHAVVTIACPVIPGQDGRS